MLCLGSYPLRGLRNDGPPHVAVSLVASGVMDALFGDGDLLSVLLAVFTVGTIAAGAAVVISALFVLWGRARRAAPGEDTTDTTNTTNTTNTTSAVTPGDVVQPNLLPRGAEAALNAISELPADPRNVVVTHRDPTGEVRLRPSVPAGQLPRSA